MKIPLSIAEKLIELCSGERIAYSKLKHPIIESMLDNGILQKQIQGRNKAVVYLLNSLSLHHYLDNHYGIQDLTKYVEALKKEALTRSESIEVGSNSKLKSIRTFKGFLVNCFQSIEGLLNNEPIIIQPQAGTFTFIYDYEGFIPHKDITIVGIENPENFRYIQQQQQLFADIQPLFVSRYPQSKDLMKWLLKIPNPYLHFGDFDVAGLNIYCNEYKKHLQNQAQFFLPNDIEQLLATKGNRENYNNQSLQFNKDEIGEENVLILLSLIEKYKKGLEQEILIGR